MPGIILLMLQKSGLHQKLRLVVEIPFFTCFLFKIPRWWSPDFWSINSTSQVCDIPHILRTWRRRSCYLPKQLEVFLGRCGRKRSRENPLPKFIGTQRIQLPLSHPKKWSRSTLNKHQSLSYIPVFGKKSSPNPSVMQGGTPNNHPKSQPKWHPLLSKASSSDH